MGYLFGEIVLYLVGAGLIGFVFGWAVRDGVLDKYFPKFTSSKTKEETSTSTEERVVSSKNDEKASLLTTTKKVVKEEQEDVKKTEASVEKVATETITEVVAEETKVEAEKTVEVKEEESKVEESKTEVVEKETRVDVVKEAVAPVDKEVQVPTPAKVNETIDEPNKPVLLTKAPEVGQDKLSTIKGIGPVLEKKLNALGVYSFEQIASWDTEQEVWIGTQMAFPKRVTKEEWVNQAKELLKNK
ncbi:MAG: Unknown protein [uncultured Sulfurovum sp.]|uniref:NADH-ubiquinone oxidoreductase chain E (EC) n=1 Tax=uncultured Sulfurovum sp. TaxID=269237 RepID=A0A6S6TTW5_9BACT|nr:MAG: Unknown protein [uncultured Sulfurovum sp.]